MVPELPGSIRPTMRRPRLIWRPSVSGPLDTTFSYITSRALPTRRSTARVSLSVSAFPRRRAETELNVLQVFPDSPASEGGMARGDRIRDQRPIGGGACSRRDHRQRIRRQRSRRLGRRCGPFAGGRRASVHDDEASCHDSHRLAHTHVSGRRADGGVPPCSATSSHPVHAALDEAFAALREARATDSSSTFATTVAGSWTWPCIWGALSAARSRKVECSPNTAAIDRNTALDETLRFESPAQALGLSRLVVITGIVCVGG